MPRAGSLAWWGSGPCATLRLNIFTCLQGLPLKFFDRTPIGRLMARNTSDVDALNEFFTYGAVSLVTEAVTIASILFYIFFYLDVELGLITCAFLPVAFAATMWLQSRTYQAFRQARTHFARFSADLQETLSGIEVVKLFNCEPRSARRFNQGTDEYLDARLVRTLYHSGLLPLYGIVRFRADRAGTVVRRRPSAARGNRLGRFGSHAAIRAPLLHAHPQPR